MNEPLSLIDQSTHANTIQIISMIDFFCSPGDNHAEANGGDGGGGGSSEVVLESHSVIRITLELYLISDSGVPSNFERRYRVARNRNNFRAKIGPLARAQCIEPSMANEQTRFCQLMRGGQTHIARYSRHLITARTCTHTAHHTTPLPGQSNPYELFLSDGYEFGKFAVWLTREQALRTHRQAVSQRPSMWSHHRNCGAIVVSVCVVCVCVWVSLCVAVCRCVYLHAPLEEKCYSAVFCFLFSCFILFLLFHLFDNIHDRIHHHITTFNTHSLHHSLPLTRTR